MLSRVADSIYWMSRYVERAENVARFISVNLHLSLDLPGEGVQQWLPLVVTTGDEKAFAARYDTASKANVIQFLTFDRDNPNSILSCLMRRPGERARRAGDHLAGDVGAHQSLLPDAQRQRGVQAALENPYDFYEQIRVSGQQFMGVTDATMTHGEAWHFCRLGRSIEAGRQNVADPRRQILHPAAQPAGRGHALRRHSMVGPAALGERV